MLKMLVVDDEADICDFVRKFALVLINLPAWVFTSLNLSIYYIIFWLKKREYMS